MKATEFCYWLQGYFELHGDIGAEGLSKRQVDLIQSHLALVFKHDIDPQAGPPQHQQVLNNIHGGKEQFRC
jgi:hypothetical protein